MLEVTQKSLIIRKETPFDRLRKSLLMMFFQEEYQLERRIEGLVKPRTIDVSKIVIPKEIQY